MKLSIFFKRGIAFLIDICTISIISKFIHSRFQITNINFTDTSIVNIFHCNFGLKISQYSIIESFVFLFYFIVLENYTKIFSVGKYILKIGISPNYTLKQVLLRIFFKYFIFITIPLTVIYFILFNKQTLLSDYLFKTTIYIKSDKVLKV